MIKYFENGQIDRKKWDNCIMNSRQKMVYSLSWYLDLVSPGWGGLVEDDYKSVMALPQKKRYGINYIIQPIYTQQLGIYSSYIPDAKKMRQFLAALPSKFRYINFNLNYLHDFSDSGNMVSKRVNYELKLNHPYKEIEKGFTNNTRRNIKKTLPYIELSESLNINDLTKLKRNNSVIKRKAEFYEWLNILMHGVISRGKGFLVGAFYKDELVAAAFFIFCGGRIYYLVPVSNNTGKKQRAMFAIIDYVIGKYADTGLIFDFEGSGIKGIARFFAGFGAKPVNYYVLKINKLPFFLRPFKR